jgi:hypothetical protein
LNASIFAALLDIAGLITSQRVDSADRLSDPGLSRFTQGEQLRRVRRIAAPRAREATHPRPFRSPSSPPCHWSAARAGIFGTEQEFADQALGDFPRLRQPLFVEIAATAAQGRRMLSRMPAISWHRPLMLGW